MCDPSAVVAIGIVYGRPSPSFGGIPLRILSNRISLAACMRQTNSDLARDATSAAKVSALNDRKFIRVPRVRHTVLDPLTFIIDVLVVEHHADYVTLAFHFYATSDVLVSCRPFQALGSHAAHRTLLGKSCSIIAGMIDRFDLINVWKWWIVPLLLWDRQHGGFRRGQSRQTI